MYKDITGQQFGRLTAVRYLGKVNGNPSWLCICSCNNLEVIIKAKGILNGDIKSCGCLRKEHSKKASLKHGLRNHPEYKRWLHIKDRCYNLKNPDYKTYGARGIGVCQEWKNNAKAYIEWAINHSTYKPGLTIERNDVNKDYSPDNCKFIDNKLQGGNKTNTYHVAINDEYFTAYSPVLRKFNPLLSESSFRERLEKMTLIEALFRPKNFKTTSYKRLKRMVKKINSMESQ